MSELRQDIVSGDWTLLSPGRAFRPNAMDRKKAARKPSPKSTCPFEDLKKGGGWPPIIAYPNNENWKIAVVPNKYPALTEKTKGEHSKLFKRGIYPIRTAVGAHWLLLTRDHNKHFADLSAREAAQVFEVFREAHEMETKDKSVKYVTSFYNYGPGAGASIWHPHYQILSLPIVPTHTVHSIRGAREYFQKNKRCVRCDIIKTERRHGARVIAENDHAIALAPYASKKPFEVSVLPKRHWPSFRETPPEVMRDVAMLLQSVLRKMKTHLSDPDLNFFIHDTPLDNKDSKYHHWHIEVLPRVSTDAGFEFSTGIIINIIDPDAAAAILRGDRPRHLSKS
jgi:UDPglucose--hexose-1-phosphate uridylyltransferase